MTEPSKESKTQPATVGAPLKPSSESPESSHKPKPRKRDRFSPRKVQIDGKTYWQVSIGSEIRERADGRRVRIRLRRTFRDAAEAKTFSERKRIERLNFGTAGVSMDEQLRSDAIAAQKILAPFGISILDAAREYVRRAQLLSKSETVGAAVSALLEAKGADHLRPRYLNELRIRLRRFSERFETRKLADITSGEMDAWLRSLDVAPLTRNTFRLHLSVLFTFALAQGWVTSNPVQSVHKVKADDSLPGILTPEQAARLLEASNHQTLPYFAIGLFAGLRSAELVRLEWKDIHWEGGLIEVPARSSKTASRRFVRIQPNLALWLEPYRNCHGPICPPVNLRKRLEADRRNAGITNWPSNALRHSFGSYHLAAFRDAKDLALEMGHTRTEITLRYYRELVKPALAEKFWRIVPAISAQPKIALVG
jgi:integrase